MRKVTSSTPFQEALAGAAQVNVGVWKDKGTGGKGGKPLQNKYTLLFSKSQAPQVDFRVFFSSGSRIIESKGKFLIN